MKHILNITLSVVVLSFFMACTESSTQKETGDQREDTLVSTEKKAPEAYSKKDSLSLEEEKQMNEKPEETAEVSKYICPNSCPEGHVDESGDCSACGMELIENPDYSAISD